MDLATRRMTSRGGFGMVGTQLLPIDPNASLCQLGRGTTGTDRAPVLLHTKHNEQGI